MTTEEPKLVRKSNPRPEGRAGLKALSLLIAVLAFVGLCSSAVLVVAMTFLQQVDGRVTKSDDLQLARRYSDLGEVDSPRQVGQMIVEDSLKRIDFGPFFERQPLSTFYFISIIRIILCGVVLLGAIFTLASKPCGPRYILGASLCVVVLGVVETLSLLHSGYSMATELYRDFEASYLHVIEVASIEGEYRNPFGGFKSLEIETVKIAGLVYFAASTVLWQLASLCMAFCKPLLPKAPKRNSTEMAA